MKPRIIYLLILASLFHCKLFLNNTGDPHSDAYRKTQLLRCLLGLCDDPFASLRWREVYRLPTANLIEGGAFVSDQIGFMIGSGGLVMRSSDSGSTWNRLVAGDRQKNILAIDINPSSKEIFIAGGKSDYTSVYFQSSSNSGRTWKNILIDGTGIITSLHFTNENLGFLVLKTQTASKFYITRDRGANWSLQSDVSGYISGFKMFDNGVGYHWGTDTAVTMSLIRKTTNFGQTWQDLSINTGSTASDISASFTNPNFGIVSIVVSGVPEIRKTTDGGNTYSSQTVSGLSEGSTVSVYLWDSNNGFLLGYNKIASINFSSVYKTQDGGNTWNLAYSDPQQSNGIIGVLGNMTRKNQNEYFVFFSSAVEASFLYSEDGGSNWKVRSTGDNIQFGRVAIVSDTLGYTSGGFSSFPRSVFRTKDGGTTWSKIYTGANGLFRDIFANNNGFVCSVGANRDIVYSNDGGETWSLPSSFGAITTTTEFRGVSFNKQGIGLLAGRPTGTSGMIARSTDNGSTWTIVLNTTAWVTNVRFINESLAIATSGVGGTASSFGVYLSSDSGINWTQIPSTAGLSLYDLSIVNESLIYASSGAIATNQETGYKSQDGGLTWTTIFQKTGPTTQNVAIGFSDQNRGLISGSSGTWKTENGGLTWTEELRWSDSGFLGISYLPSKNRIIGTGGSGTIQYRSWP
ncbi:WD40/YVTN/BNR-like repeat-containing protein [Leptospira ilyithenensis]|uniref:Photosynthesis system II assembly factor Ycf48/Hcf136-like domain-containing protein n=1 Tax=Leptospira ilyithenensis TaxID=2484901 RepID=A0A4R9LRY0_9LEPT|nr:YCF48-related protein [Leptospira ilyithenensis]TGN10024.1 hypothetical protein EHS11_10700 [Leptospira ilyithenensis]